MKSGQPRKVLIDTDCGVDDAIALLIALASPELEVVAVTTVSGNVGVGQVTDNVLRLLSRFGRKELPVYRGASRALAEPPRTAAGIHGENGLGGVQLPRTERRAEELGAPEAMYRIARAQPGLTLLTLGPLTNLALALNLFPEIGGSLGEVVVMGGALERGNVTPHAEFNFFADPEAAQLVLDSGVPMTIVTWDAALRGMFSETELRGLGLEASAAGRLLLEMEACAMDYLEKIFGRKVVALPDPLTAAWLVDSTAAAATVETSLRVELAPGPKRGASLVVGPDDEGEGFPESSPVGRHSVRRRPVRLVTEIDKQKFTDILLRIQKL